MELYYKSGRMENIYRHEYVLNMEAGFKHTDDAELAVRGPAISILEGARHTIQVVGDFDGCEVSFEGSNFKTLDENTLVPLVDNDGYEIVMYTPGMELVRDVVSHIRPVVDNMSEKTKIKIVVISRVA